MKHIRIFFKAQYSKNVLQINLRFSYFVERYCLASDMAKKTLPSCENMIEVCFETFF